MKKLFKKGHKVYGGFKKGVHASTVTEFKKGQISWIKDKHHTEVSKQKISLKLKGRKLSEETKRKMQLFHIGKHNSEKHNKKISEIRKKLFKEGKLVCSEETRQKRRLNRLKQIFPIKDTTIEIVLQKELNNQNIKFLTHYPIFGQPDIFIEPNICIFVDGCYWHGCEKCFNRLNKKQKERKFKDEIVNFVLWSHGYAVLRFWEHDIKNNSKQCMNKIIEQIEINKIEVNK